MKTFEADITDLCEKLDDCISGSGIDMEAIEKVTRLLEYLRDNAINIEYASEGSIHARLHEVISCPG